MRLVTNSVVLAATDLAHFLACEHRTALDLAAAVGTIPTPIAPLDAALKMLQERGAAHERAYVEHLRSQGVNVFEIPSDQPSEVRCAQTLDALKSGVDALYQGAFAGRGWIGYADILRKVPCRTGVATAFGAFQYEPYDAKLARDTRGGTILQLALYAELLGEIQGVYPKRFLVVSPGSPFTEHEYRLADYVAYFRSIRTRMLTAIAKGPDALLGASYPEPVEHCDICRWWDRCNQRRRDDDHLSFIAGISRSQRTELVSQGVTTLAAAAAFSRPSTIPGGSDNVLVTSTLFNTAGEAEQITDPAGNVIKSTLDHAGRLSSKTEDFGTSPHLNRETQFTYNLDGRLKYLTAKNATTGDQITEFVFGVSPLDGSDVASNDYLRAKIYPDSTSGTDRVEFKVNRLGEVKEVKDQLGTVRVLDYDKLGRLR